MRFNLAKVPVGGGLLLGLSLGILCVWLSQYLLPTQNYRQAYGQALADLTALYSAEELFHQNLVAQQSLLSELVNYPQVAVAAIQDKQKNLLVQAGNKDYPRLPVAKTFTAPIRLDDRIAGYVSVTLVEPLDTPAKVQMAITWLSPLCLLIALWSITQSGAVEFRRKVKRKKAEKQQKAPVDSSVETEINCEQAYVAIDIKNSRLLKRQLSAGVYQTTLASLEHIANKVLLLYNGSLGAEKEDRYILDFEDSESGQVTLNAVCCAYLIIELAKTINNIPLELTAYISNNRETLKPDEDLPVAALALDLETSKNTSLKQRLQTSPLGQDSCGQLLTAIDEPTKRLLEKQYRQLANII